jgi:hypothetical protein
VTVDQHESWLLMSVVAWHGSPSRLFPLGVSQCIRIGGVPSAEPRSPAC